MGCTNKQDIKILQGKTFDVVLRWETGPIVYKPITAIAQSAPAAITVVGHDAPEGWRVAIVSVKGMTQINANMNPPDVVDYHKATVVDADTIELNDVNSAEFKAYVSGGYVQYNTPASLSGYVARLVMKTRIGGDVLLSLTTENDGIVLDDTAKTISLYISATDTEEIDWTTAVYELEMESAAGKVTTLLYGEVSVTKEIAV